MLTIKNMYYRYKYFNHFKCVYEIADIHIHHTCNYFRLRTLLFIYVNSVDCLCGFQVFRMLCVTPPQHSLVIYNFVKYLGKKSQRLNWTSYTNALTLAFSCFLLQLHTAKINNARLSFKEHGHKITNFS